MEVVDALRDVCLIQILRRLQFDQHNIFNEQVCHKVTDHYAIKPHIDRNLLTHSQSLMRERDH